MRKDRVTVQCTQKKIFKQNAPLSPLRFPHRYFISKNLTLCGLIRQVFVHGLVEASRRHAQSRMVGSNLEDMESGTALAAVVVGMGLAGTGSSLEDQWGQRPEDMVLCIEIEGEVQEARQDPEDDGWQQEAEYGHGLVSLGLKPALLAVVLAYVVALASIPVSVRPVLPCVVHGLLDREPALVLEQCQH